MIERIKVQDWTGKIIGFIELDTSTGNKQIKDFSGKIKGKYNAKLDITTDFYGRQIATGDQLIMTLNM